MWLELPTGMEHITRFNTELFRYLGSSAVLGPHETFNHIRITDVDEETGELESCVVIFADHEDYDEVSRFMLRWNYPQHFNLPRVSEFVQYAFDATHGVQEGEVSFPEFWANPDAEVDDSDLPPDPNSYDLGEDDE